MKAILIAIASIAAMAGVVSMSACAKPPSLYADTAPTRSPPPQVSVLAADVLVVDGRHLRLTDLDVPRPAPHARCVAEALAARQARQRLQELSQGVDAVMVTPAGDQDDHGRIRAQVLFDGHDPADTLIDEGLAVRPGASPMDWCGPISSALPRGNHIAMLSMAGS